MKLTDEDDLTVLWKGAEARPDPLDTGSIELNGNRQMIIANGSALYFLLLFRMENRIVAEVSIPVRLANKISQKQKIFATERLFSNVFRMARDSIKCYFMALCLIRTYLYAFAFCLYLFFTPLSNWNVHNLLSNGPERVTWLNTAQ